jgi:hypothetical protein
VHNQSVRNHLPPAIIVQMPGRRSAALRYAPLALGQGEGLS